MNFLRLLPVLISFLLIAAHFYRSGHLLLVVVLLGMPLLLLVRNTWVPGVMQAVLLLAAMIGAIVKLADGGGIRP